MTVCKQERVLVLNWIVWNRIVFMFNCAVILETNKWKHLTVCQKICSVSFKNVIYKMCLEIIFDI